MKRKPAVAGQFYSSNPTALSEEVRGYFEKVADKQKVIGVLSPHAGLMYSGAVAGAVFSRIEAPETFIILSPNHTGLGSIVSIMSNGSWQIPTGELEIDEDIAAKLLKQCRLIEDDSLAHKMEHSIEVQLPFLHKVNPDAKIVPVCMMDQSLEGARDVADSVVVAEEKLGRKVVVVASSDFSHHLPAEVAKKNDSRRLGIFWSWILPGSRKK